MSWIFRKRSKMYHLTFVVILMLPQNSIVLQSQRLRDSFQWAKRHTMVGVFWLILRTMSFLKHISGCSAVRKLATIRERLQVEFIAEVDGQKLTGAETTSHSTACNRFNTHRRHFLIVRLKCPLRQRTNSKQRGLKFYLKAMIRWRLR